MRYVIIGNSAAGIGAVEGIRQIDKKGRITVISDEPHHTYARPLISYLLQGKTDRERMKYRGESFYRDNSVTLLSGVAVQAISPAKKNVVLSDGKLISYDKLLVATGSRAFVPPIAGLEAVSDKTTFMTLSDAEALGAALSPNSRVLIVGAGLIGLKCAEGILKRVKEVTVADVASRVLPNILDKDGAKMVQECFECNGTRFVLGKAVARFEHNRAVFDDGEAADFDMLVLAAGVRPNTELLKDIAETGRGIRINAKSETSVKDIYAAGDCTEMTDASSAETKVMALLPNAYIQGECAGVHMAGGETCFDCAIPMNAVGFFGLHLVTAGTYAGEIYESRENDGYKKLFYSNNKLNGYMLIGDVSGAGIYTALVRERTPLDTLDFGLLCQTPTLAAYPLSVRSRKLGGFANG